MVSIVSLISVNSIFLIMQQKALAQTVSSNPTTTDNITNQPPVAQDQSVQTNINTSTNITLSAIDMNQNDELTAKIISYPSNGVLSNNINQDTGVITYAPNTNFVGQDSFTYNVNDGKADSNIATVSITINNNTTEDITGNNFLIYQNPTYGINMQYPSDWIVSQNGLENFNDVVGFYSPLEDVSDVFPEHMIVSVYLYSKNISLGEYNTLLGQALLGQGPESFGLRIIESNLTSLAGNPAHKMVLSTLIGNESSSSPPPPTISSNNSSEAGLKIMQIWTVKGNKVYTITFSAPQAKYDNYLPTIQKMIDSFEIKG